MKAARRILFATILLIIVGALFTFIVFQSSIIPRCSYSANTTVYHSWREILSHPKPITVQTYSTGSMQTRLSDIMNLEHMRAADIQDLVIKVPVIVCIIQHQKFGTFLIDAGLDSSYVTMQYGTTKGILVRKKMGNGSQVPNTHIAAVLEEDNIQLQGVWLTHLHPDHVAGIVNLPKEIPYVVGKGERYINFRFLIQTDHLSGIDQLHEIDLNKGVDLPPFAKCVDLFGDGSFWAIESSGHTRGHIMYFINGVDEPVLVTGDACNNQFQFDTGIGPGYFSDDVEKAQEILEAIKLFKEQYPEVKLVFGHDIFVDLKATNSG